MNFEQEDKIVSSFLQSLGPWAPCIIIGGGYALIIYKIYFSDISKGNPPTGTRDIDSLIPRKIPTMSRENISTFLLNAGFKQSFKDFQDPATEFYKKNIEETDIIIEFITDDSVRKDKEKNVLISGVVAQSLSFLKLGLENILPFSTQSGENGFVVEPAAWIFQKGLTFTRRTDKKKVYKDLYGIWYVGTQLGNFSTETITDLKGLFEKHPKWAVKFKNHLLDWIKMATPFDWSQLESQDNYGGLNKLHFKSLVENICSD
jgi:hypothetical protein